MKTVTKVATPDGYGQVVMSASATKMPSAVVKALRFGMLGALLLSEASCTARTVQTIGWKDGKVVESSRIRTNSPWGDKNITKKVGSGGLDSCMIVIDDADTSIYKRSPPYRARPTAKPDSSSK